mmetsp:Transcript_7060/g.19768  ORF Transcript_7060/g.19768 Transcript_7060/m.19768 type:complete len:132 (-) Transcript_7060:32-427(-)
MAKFFRLRVQCLVHELQVVKASHHYARAFFIYFACPALRIVLFCQGGAYFVCGVLLLIEEKQDSEAYQVRFLSGPTNAMNSSFFPSFDFFRTGISQQSMPFLPSSTTIAAVRRYSHRRRSGVIPGPSVLPR